MSRLFISLSCLRFSCIRWESKSSPCYSVLGRSRVHTLLVQHCLRESPPAPLYHSASQTDYTAKPQEPVTDFLSISFGWRTLELLFWFQNHLHPGECHWFPLFYSQQSQACVLQSCPASQCPPSPIFGNGKPRSDLRPTTCPGEFGQSFPEAQDLADYSLQHKVDRYHKTCHNISRTSYSWLERFSKLCL